MDDKRTEHSCVSASGADGCLDSQHAASGYLLGHRTLDLSAPITLLLDLVELRRRKAGFNPFNASCSKLLLFEGFSAILV